MNGERYLVVIADDFGMGPATSQGIMHLAAHGRVTGTVLLVNSPFAEHAVHAWRAAGSSLELGWHPCLTLDQPLLSPNKVSSLVDADGCLWPLGTFLRRWALGQIQAGEIQAELRAQYRHFRELAGHWPQVVNSHQHIALFPPVGQILLDILQEQKPLPYVRRICEPWRLLAGIRGARIKRFVLSVLGGRHARRQKRLGFPGNEWLAGITDPPFVADPQFFVRWLAQVTGQVVELACHPGHLDPTLIGRDCTPADGMLQRRVAELHLLMDPSFPEACARAGFRLVTAAELLHPSGRGRTYAA